MPINKNAAFRYKIIDSCLRNNRKRYPGLQFIQEKVTEALGLNSFISVSSLNKDFKAMRDFYKAPIKYSYREGGYYYDDPDFSINNYPFSPDEIEALDVSTAFLRQLKYSGFFKNFETVVNKLLNGYRIGDISGLENAKIIQTEEPASDNGVGWIALLLEAIVCKNQVSVKYQRFNTDQPKTHHFSPYVLKEYRNRWYVTGYSIEAKSLTSLVLDRVQSIELLKEGFVQDPHFEEDKYFTYSFGATVHPLAAPEKVELLFNKSLEGYFKTKPLHHTQQLQQSKDGILVQIECYITPELEMTILSYGEQVKALAPHTLVQRIKKRVEALSYVYR